MKRLFDHIPTMKYVNFSCRLIVFTALATGVTFFVDAASANPPNVLFLISDDLNCRIGCYGDPVAKTPNLDRLAKMGVRFERAYCQQPICNPSRASVLSGRYPTSTGVLDQHTSMVLEGDQKILPRYFGAQGYTTAEFGKIWNSPIWHAPNGGTPETLVVGGGGDKAKAAAEFFTPAQRAEQQKSQPDFWKHSFEPYRSAPPNPERYALVNAFGPSPAEVKETDTKTADRAIAWLGQRRGDDKPFFLSVGFLKPHVPLKCPKEYFDLYDPAALPLPPDFAKEPTGPANTPPDDLRPSLDLFACRSFTAAEARAALHAYYACVSYMDAQLGRVLDALEKNGLWENTIIVFLSDHGWHLSDKGMWGKGTLFESAARGPLVIVDPREKGTTGQASPRVVQYLDIFPTLVELCGVEKPAWLEGESLAPLLKDPQATWDKPAFTVQPRDWFIGRSIRTERWRYTEWDEGRRGNALFDHDNDPHEMRNLATDPAHKDTVVKLQQQLRESKVGRALRRPMADETQTAEGVSADKSR